MNRYYVGLSILSAVLLHTTYSIAAENIAPISKASDAKEAYCRDLAERQCVHIDHNIPMYKECLDEVYKSCIHSPKQRSGIEM